ncbi:putative sieve element occlusion [Helianthus annuus]|nr:putative sieve element occlusion [Helianthus annuus]KAJ0554692.1 putative sieve element occlusion [Helianthus annuus]KAJ0720256.1 putative sieve element occlusion [Helianthus annuus]KAJ0723472.1 putative sieve element occlusion [Helianthus annuus]KAJ0899267.1 putative sieve element occlusion [Helianthus annuus]
MQQQQQVVKKDRRMFASSDDNAMMKQVMGTHSPDGRDVELEPILNVVEETLHRAIPANIDGVINGTHNGHIDALVGQETLAFSSFEDDGIPDGLANVIHKISCELSCKCSGGADAHGSTMAILNILSSYSWEAKVVISLGAFAVNFGEFWLVAQLFATNPLAKSVALLKQLPNIIEHYKSIKPRFDAINELIKVMLDVTKCIIAFKNLPYQYLQDDTPPKSTALSHIPTAVYWSIKSMVACVSQLTSLLGMNFEYISATSEAWELSSLAHKVHNIHEHLKELLHLCKQNIEEKQHDEYFLMLMRIFEVSHLDNLKILKALFCGKDDIHPLLDGSSKTRVNVDVLRRKTVLLLISDLDISHEEILVLTQIYKDSRIQPDLHYEVVWVPVVDNLMAWNDSHQHKLEQLQSMMTWHMLHHPTLLEPAVIKYIKQVWHFEKKPILVSLDPQGRVASPNALHMVWIWRNDAYPFTSMKEDALWKEETWTLELLVDSIDRYILHWIAEEKYICLYGGDNLEWIRSFTKIASDIAATAGIPLEMVYVGKSGTKERIRKISTTISEEKLSHTWPDPTFVWYFWTRLESMLYSKIHHQHGNSFENDPIMKEVMTMMSFDGSDRGWALICKGSREMGRANAELAETSLVEYENWEGDVQEYGFVPAWKAYLAKLHKPQHCNRLILPGISGGIPEVVVCSECGRTMEKFFMFRCCTD